MKLPLLLLALSTLEGEWERGEVWADGWAEGEGGLAGLSSCAEVRGRRVRAEGEGGVWV